MITAGAGARPGITHWFMAGVGRSRGRGRALIYNIRYYWNIYSTIIKVLTKLTRTWFAHLFRHGHVGSSKDELSNRGVQGEAVDSVTSR